MGLIWEISGHLSDQSSWFFGARLFCKNTKKSGFNDIYNIQFFQDTYSQNGFFRKCFSHPTRPPAGPYCPYNILGQFWIILTGFPYKIILLWVILTGFPVFPGSNLNQNDWLSSISRFETESKWLVFQYFQVQNWLNWLLFQYFPNSELFRLDFHITLKHIIV